MMSLVPKLQGWERMTPNGYNALVERINVLSQITGQGGTKVISNPVAGITIRGGGGDGNGRPDIRLFEVQSAASGDGIYNCYEQTLDATEWGDTAGDDRLDDKDAVSVEVMNLREFHVAASYQRGLAKLDRIQAWQMLDDEGGARWVGLPLVPDVRRFQTTEAAPADYKINCNVIMADGGEAGAGELLNAIDITCEVHNGTNLDDAIPRLENDEQIFATHIYGVWYCVTPFQGSEDCVCS